jgi:gamma-glutamyltranspeptidase
MQAEDVRALAQKAQFGRKQGAPLRPGQTLRQLPVARTLERLRDEGNEYFYRGDFAARFVEAVRDGNGCMRVQESY